VTTAVTYARLSKVEYRKQTVESVEAQIAENLAWAAEHHVEVIASFQDNLTASRFSTKDRPGFLQMMRVIRDEQPDMVIVTEQSRLDRQLWNILEPIELARATTFKKIVRVRDDDVIDLSSEGGINRTIDQANRDRHESELISQRVKAKKRRQAQDGQFPGGRRPFGYEKDGLTLKEDEAAIIRECARRLRDGASLGGLTKDLNRRSVPTAFGGRWQRSTLQFIFRNKRIIGVRVHHGVEYPAQWPAILSREEWDEVQLVLDAKHTTPRRTKSGRTYLLTGFVVCTLCGNHMTGSGHSRKGNGVERRYYCQPVDSTGLPRGCGKVARLAEPLETLVTRAVLYRLDSEGLAYIFAAASQDDDIQAAMAGYQAMKSRLGNLLADYYLEFNKYAKDEMRQLKAELEARLEQITRKMERLDSTRILKNVPVGQQVKDLWEGADQAVRRNLIALLIEKIEILPIGRDNTRWHDDVTGQEWRFDPTKVEIVWKV
jgi:site-specific DNA recombinase